MVCLFSIDQQVINLTKKEKYKSLLKVISKIDGLIMVFMKTKRETKRITKNLQDENYKAGFMNGDLPLQINCSGLIFLVY